MPTPVTDQAEDLVVEHSRLGGPSPSRLELGLQNQMLSIDKHIAMMHIEEYRSLLATYFSRGILAAEPSPVARPPGQSHPALLPTPAPGSSSQILVAQPAALLGGPPVTVEVATTGLRQPDAVPSVPTVPGPCVPTSSRPAPPRSLLSSRLNSGASGVPGRGRGRGGRGRGRGRGHRSTAATNTRVYPAGGSPSRHDPLSVSAHASARSGNNRFCSRAAVELYLRENGVEASSSSSLTPQDAALADATPAVTQKGFKELFGGNAEHERPRSRERNIVCLNPAAQPYGPSSPGQSGLLLLPPATVRSEDMYSSFHVFSNTSPPMTRASDRMYRYLGTYAKVPTIRTTVEANEWLSLPYQCREIWSWRLFTRTSSDVRAMHARIGIRKTRPQGPPPSPDEIDAWLGTYPDARTGITEATLVNAFDTGDENLDVAVIKCVGYSADIAWKLQGQVAPNWRNSSFAQTWEAAVVRN